MKVSLIATLGWAALELVIAATPVEAQVLGLGFSVTPSTDALLVSNSLTYTINVTNGTGFILSDLWVTNTFSAPVTIGTISFTLGNGVNYNGFVYTNGNTVLFDFNQFRTTGTSTGVGQASFSLVPDPASFGSNGFLTNGVVAIVPASQNVTNTVSTNVVVQITNAIVKADLGVSISGFGQGILEGDTVTYRATVTNRGPDAVPGVLLTNALPAGTAVISVSPTNHPSTLRNGVLVFNLGTLTNAAASLVTLTVQLTNSGLQTFSVSVGAAGLEDPNPSNNTFSTNINVGTVILGQIIVTNASPMVFDPQTGLMDQTVRLVNVSTSAVDSVRLTVSGLTNWLYDAVGTNNGNPFVVYPNPLNANQSADVVLEYFIPTRLPIGVADSNYTAVAISAFNLTAPTSTNGVFSITRAVLLSNGELLIEFPSVQGASYSILYSTNASFSNPLIAQPEIIAPADRVQWIDEGPPKTISAPASATSRFYRVIKN